MKYQPTFDQVVCVDLGFNSVDGMLLDFIIEAPIWADKIVHNNEEYFYLAHSKIMNELPTLFNSKQSITRAIQRLSEILSIEKKGRNNFYKVDSRLVEVWKSKSKGDKYDELKAELFQKRNSTGNDTIPETERYRSDNGTIEDKTVPKTEPIIQPSNPPTKILQLGRFTRPSVDECKNYLSEIGASPGAITDHANRFIDHYESVGWVVGAGGNPMKDWEASLRAWVMRSKDFKKDGGGVPPPESRTAADYHEGVNPDGSL